MATDEVIKKLLVEIAVKTDRAISDMQEVDSAVSSLRANLRGLASSDISNIGVGLREGIESAKVAIVSLQKALSETVDVASRTARIKIVGDLETQLVGARNALRESRSELRELSSEFRRSARAAEKLNEKAVELIGRENQLKKEALRNSSKIAAIQEKRREIVSKIATELSKQRELESRIVAQKERNAAISAEILSLQQQIKFANRTITDATVELRREEKGISADLGTRNEIYGQIRGNIEQAKLEMMEMAASGKQMDDIMAVLRKEGMFNTSELNQAKREFKEIFNFGTRIAEVGSRDDLYVGLRDNIDQAKLAMMGMVSSGKNLDETMLTLRKEGMFDVATLNQAKKEFKEIFDFGTRIAEIGGKRSLSDILVGDTDKIGDFDTLTKSFENQLRGMVSETMSLDAAYQQLMASTKGLAGMQAPLATAFKRVKREAKSTGAGIKWFSRILERIFAAAAIGIALNAVRRFINALQEMTNKAQEARVEFVKFVIEARNLQKVGIDVTVGEWSYLIEEFGTKFTRFTEKDLYKGIGKIVRLGRQLRLTKQEMKELADHVATMATVLGKDFTSAVDATLNTIERGRITNAFSDMYGPVDEPTLASEAVARGLAENTEAVDKYTRFLTVLQIAYEEATEAGEEFAYAQEDISGKLTAVTADIEDESEDLGKAFLSIKLYALKLWRWILDASRRIFIFFQHITIFFTTGFSGSIITAIELVKNLGAVIRGELSIADIITNEFTDAFIAAVNIINPTLWDDFADSIDGVAQSFEDAADSAEEYMETIDELMKKLEDAWLDTLSDISKENRKFMQQMAEDARKYAHEIRQAYDKYLFDQAKIIRSSNDKIKEANEDFRDREISAEEKHQEQLRKLREKFLYDLEDALRERDARQVLRLIRDFNLRKEQLGRERELERQENERRLQDELNNIKRQREARLRELRLEYEFRRKQMEEDIQFQRARRQEDHEQRLEEIRIRWNERNQEILRGYEEQLNITDEMARKITEVLNNEFGPGGNVEKIYDYLVQMILTAVGVVSASITALNNISVPVVSYTSDVNMRSYDTPTVSYTSDVGMSNYDYAGDYAEGGTVIAKKPTIAVFGEKEPELAHFSPINRVGKDVNKLFGDVGGLRFGGSEGLVKVQLWLSPDLEARVVDQSVGVVADIIDGKIL